MKRVFVKVLAFCLGLLLIADVVAQEEDKVDFKFGGYAKTDFMFSQYNNGPLAAGRDVHIPSLTPVGEADSYRYTDFHAKQSRFNFDVSTLTGGKKLRAFIEMDFLGSSSGNEVATNSYNPRLRHFYIEYDKLVVGQTWSTFMVVVVPDALDLLGTPEGFVVVRQPVIRYTAGSWQFALENPYVTYNSDTMGTKTHSESAYIPDVVVRKNFKFDGGKFSIAAIGRQLHYMDALKTNHTAFGGGVTMGGQFKVGEKDDIRFMGSAGQGLGRYLALNFISSAAVDESLNLKPILSMNGFVSYRHVWSDKFRSSAAVSYFKAVNDEEIIGGLANDKSMCAMLNLLYSPVNNLMFGVEGRYGYRELVNGTSGDFYRVQATAKYAFSFKTSMNK